MYPSIDYEIKFTFNNFIYTSRIIADFYVGIILLLFNREKNSEKFFSKQSVLQILLT